MPYYRAVGEVPRKRHTQFRKPDGSLYAEELMGVEGFSPASALPYHHNLPTPTPTPAYAPLSPRRVVGRGSGRPPPPTPPGGPPGLKKPKVRRGTPRPGGPGP